MTLNLYIASSKENVLPKTIFVDSHIDGAALVLDHHVSGEKTNLDLVLQRSPDNIQAYDAIASTHLDTDAILSAVVLLYGPPNLSHDQKDVLRAACLWCDYLICDPPQERCEQGLLLHHYLKQTGFVLHRQMTDKKYLTDEQKTAIFRQLVTETIEMLKTGHFKADRTYSESLEKVKNRARESIVFSDEIITVIRSPEYLDPIATYAVHNSLSQVILNPEINRYEVGIHPRHYNKGADLRAAVVALNLAETNERSAKNQPTDQTWGGRSTAFGSPRSAPGEISSVLNWERVKEIVEKVVRKQVGKDSENASYIVP